MISLCKHRFPIQPPHGSLARPGECSGCGATWAAVEAELDRQADVIRHNTAHEGDCERCGRPRMLFAFQRAAQPWDDPDTEPPVRWLCAARCWGAAKDVEESTGFFDIRDAFEDGSDAELVRFVFGGAR